MLVNNTTVKLILIHDIPDSKVIPKNCNTGENSIIWQYCNNFNIVTQNIIQASVVVSV